MKPSILRLLLGISVLFNLGVLAALGWQQLSHGLFNDTGEPLLARELELDEQQRQRWQQIEAPFLVELQQSAAAIQQQHDRLIHSIFARSLDVQRIRTEQQALASLQQQQQQRVIEQLLKEREILDERQRQRLVELLTQQTGTLEVERLHSQ
ncbi:periplasmic heavy metal sensor [Halopseudomonas sp. SMJS2]|uniref:periplasmic heavy metal sensor n=1 Tax=Halopseudomonas TaxID=2901189 RepID=UPI002452BB6E|nr:MULTISPECIES: periplasmic heavy metal sensor [Halopseudomonas]WGK62177.1 periplasmic heavy metal sensor [Halopseudomonas sp. SMJS2]